MSGPSRSMTLVELLGDDIDCADIAWQSVRVTGISLDTRALAPGDVYLALPGRSTHGMQHAASAIRAGAVAIATVPGAAALAESLAVPVVEVAALETRLAELADRFFGAPAESLRIIAVTGTDGKTSVCRFVAEAFAALGHKAGYIGTIGWGLVSSSRELADTSLTTPDAIVLRKMLRDMLDAGANVVALEASSHGISEGRLAGLSIDVAVLTNLGRDHLDYHGTQEAYADSKARLFAWPSLQGIVVNADDTLGQALVARHHRDWAQSRRLATFAIDSAQAPDEAAASADCRVASRQVNASAAGLDFELLESDFHAHIASPLLGRFNVLNLLACYAVLRLSEVSAADASEVLPRLKPVPGRMDRVDARDKDNPVVIVDYAHTPDALAAAVHAAREHCRGQTYVVFGCGGDRDAGKRAPMARAATIADRIVVTDDNPRTEDSGAIISDILAGFDSTDKVVVIPDRRAAIEYAVAQCTSDDVLLIAGKGHEDYQIIGTERLAFSDHDAARTALATREQPAANEVLS